MSHFQFVFHVMGTVAVWTSTAMISMAQVPSGSRPPSAVPPPPLGTPAPGRPSAPGAGMSPGSAPVANTTTFFCGQSGNHPATLVQVGARTLQSPLIVWATNYFGENFTPQERCEIVSARMSNAVIQNGGRLSNLRLAAGTVNNQTVICVTNSYASCNTNNMLFTLRPENARNPQETLARLMLFGQRGSGEAVYESGGLGNVPADPSIDLEEAVNLAMQQESNITTPPADDPYAAPNPYTPAPSYTPTPTPAPAYSDPGYYPGGI